MRRQGRSDEAFTPQRIGAIAVGGVLLVIMLMVIFSSVTTVDAGDIVVRQGAVDGELTVWTEPGMKMQWFGRLEAYKRSGEYKFEVTKNEAGQEDFSQCYNIRFNDNGTAKLCGSVGYLLPTDKQAIKALHTEFRSNEAIFQRLIRKAVEKAVYNSGSLMSSRESTNDRRAELLTHIREQVLKGVYKVESEDAEIPDFFADPIIELIPIEEPVIKEDGTPELDESGKPKMRMGHRKVNRQPKKKVKVVKPVIVKGQIQIAEPSMVAQYGITVRNFSINRIDYDKRVKQQIEAQQKAMMGIQTARAEAQKAEQDAVTSEAKGRANIAKTKAAQEVAKQEAVTKAETKLAVAKEDLETAKTAAEAKRVTADADAYAKKQVLVADGALDKKLKAYIAVQKVWADAAAKQPLVPRIQMGGGGKSAGGIQDLMSVMAVKAAKDLDVNVTPGR